LPVLAVLLNGLLLFILATLSLESGERRTVLLVATIGAIAICGVLVLALSVVLSGPMAELQAKIQRVRDGDLNVTVSFAGRTDDIGKLGRNFNQMVTQLRESRQEIERLHNTQMSRAEHLATLGELAAGLAHEIRNPLAGIAGVMDIIGRDLPERSPARDVLKDVNREVMRVNRILNDLLETARPKPPAYRAADLNATAEHAVIFARQQALSKPVKVELHKAEGMPPVEHDPNQIQQVLLNLVLNAIQAMDEPGTEAGADLDGPGGAEVEARAGAEARTRADVGAGAEPGISPRGRLAQVDVDVGQRDGLAVVSVSDTGRGIRPEHLPNIFRPFYTTKGSGTGLGLSLARRIVEDHGGKITVRSEVGRGSTFEVMLPLRRT
jgi:signal transduction histidine kinase